MPTCANCDKKWTWGQTMKTLFRIKCPYCGEKQYETAASRQKNGIFGVVFPLLFLPIIIGFNIPIGTTFVFLVLVALILLGVYPFMLKLSNEEEPFF